MLAVVLKKPYFLMMGLMSPMMMLGSYLQGRKQGKVTYQQQLADYKDKKARIEADAAQAVVDERIARRSEAPDPATALLIASRPAGAAVGAPRHRPRLPLDPHRRRRPAQSEVTVDDPEELEHRRETTRTAYDVPVTVALAERGVVGIAGRAELPRRLASWMVAQLAVTAEPARHAGLRADRRRRRRRRGTGCAGSPTPGHSRARTPSSTLGVDTETCARRVAELTAILTAAPPGDGQPLRTR